MRASTMIWIVITVIIVFGGGWYYYSTQHSAPVKSFTNIQQPGPAASAGINDSSGQGNPGDTATTDALQPSANGAESTVIGGNVALAVGKSDTLGAYLIGYNGMTVYTFAKDKTASSTCYGQCADIWPPYVIGPGDNAQNVKLGVSASKVSTIRRADGKIQVTYDGHPLYFYAQDQAPNDTKGQNFNKVWFVVKP